MNKISAPQEPRVAPDRRPLPGAPVPSGRRRRTAAVIVIVVVVLLGLVWWINHRQSSQFAAGNFGAAGGRGGRNRSLYRGGPNAPLPVVAKAAEKGDLPIYLNALGTVIPAHVATIRTQVSGQLQQIAFQEGQFVHAGDLLAVIDPRPFQNALEQAQAQLRQAQSQLRIAQLDLDRYVTLAKQDSISDQQVDTTRSQVNQFEGLVQAAQAAIDTAKLNLTYCHIAAPFDGRVGLRAVDTGNYVTPGDANGLVVLSQVKPITVIFTLPEDNIAPISARLRAGAKLPVDAFDRTQTNKVASGTLVTIDNQIDPATGTFKLRAEFSNEDESLFPNQFVNIRLLLDTVHDATLVPASAIERGQQGSYVYVVGEDETATARDVTVGATQGERVQITSGLTVGNTVVVDGADKLKDGQKVILNQPGGSVGSAPQPAGTPRTGGHGKWGGRGGRKAAPDNAGKE